MPPFPAALLSPTQSVIMIQRRVKHLDQTVPGKGRRVYFNKQVASSKTGVCNKYVIFFFFSPPICSATIYM